MEKLLLHIEDIKNQTEEILKNRERCRNFLIGSVTVGPIVSTKAARFGNLTTLFSSHPVCSGIIILAGTILIAISLSKIQKHIEDFEELIRTLKKFKITMDKKIPKNAEKYETMASDIVIIKQLKASIVEFKVLILAEEPGYSLR